MTLTHKQTFTGVPPGLVTSTTAAPGDTPFTEVRGTGLSVTADERLLVSKPVNEVANGEWRFTARAPGALTLKLTPPSSVPATSTSFFRIKSGPSSALFVLNLMNNGTLRALGPGGVSLGNIVTQGIAFDGATEYIVKAEWLAGATNGTLNARVYLNGSSTPIGPGLALTGVAFGADTYDRIVLGQHDTTPEYPNYWLDNIGIGDDDVELAPLETPTSNTAPSATLTGPDSAAAGTSFTLTATASDADGTIASMSVVPLGTAPALAPGANGTYTATVPYSDTDQIVSYRLTVTDDDGAETIVTKSLTLKKHLTWHRIGGTMRPTAAAIGNRIQQPVTISVQVLAETDAKVSVEWTINPGDHDVAGVYAAHGGPDANGNAWESALRPGLTGTQDFGNLVNGTDYTITITPVVDGVRGTPVSVIATPTGTVTEPPAPSGAKVTTVSGSATNLFDPDGDDATPTFYTLSGLVVSKNPAGARVFWGHNDNGAGSAGGGDIRIHAFDDDAQRRIIASYTLEGTFNASGGDWEDLAWGPGPVAGQRYLYIGNFGAQATSSTNLKIYRVAEPAVTAGQARVNATIPAAQIDTFTFTRPGDTRDCESFICDPRTGDLYYFEKRSYGSTAPKPYMSRVYRCPASQLTAGSRSITWTEVASIVGSTANETNMASLVSADISEDGSAIAVATYQAAWVYNRGPGQTVTQALQGTPIYQPLSNWGTECMAFDRGLKPARLYGASEGTGATLKYLDVAWADEVVAPPTSGDGLYGVYNGGPVQDLDTIAAFGGAPEISSTYIQPGTLNESTGVVSGFAGYNEANELDRMRRGTDCLFAFTMKYTQFIADYAGENGTAAQGRATIIGDAIMDRMKALTDKAVNGRRVWFAPMHEHDVYSNTAQTDVKYTGLSGDPAVFARFMNRWIARGRSRAPKVLWVSWWGGTTRTAHIATFFNNLTVRPDAIIEDPYVNGTNFETATQNFTPVVNRYRSSTGTYRASYVRLSALGDGTPIPIGIGEHGISKRRPSTGEVRHSDQAMANYHDGTRAAMAALDIVFAVFFNRDSGPNGHHKVDDGAHPLAVAAVSRQIKARSS